MKTSLAAHRRTFVSALLPIVMVGAAVTRPMYAAGPTLDSKWLSRAADSVRAGEYIAVREIPRRYLQRLASATAVVLARRLGIAPETDLRWMVTATAS